jgi:hypothetical protein
MIGIQSAPMVVPVSASVPPSVGTDGNVILAGQSVTPGSAKAAQRLLVVVGVLALFVYGLVIVAGTGPNAGKIVVALFVALIVVQGLTHGQAFASFVFSHPLVG